jgi:hypothetical protein
MFQRVPQPPVDAARRDPERHGFWAGLVVTLIGLMLLLAGALRSTAVNTIEDRPARETELVRAFALGGLQYADQMEPPTPPVPTGDPVADAEALARWDQEQANAEAPTWRLRVDTTAKTPCPT